MRRGLLGQVDWCYEDGTKHLASDQSHVKGYIFSELGSYDLSSSGFKRLRVAKRLTVYRKILEGIDELHGLGLMHRDITVRNALVMGHLNARIFDWGKCTNKQEDNETALGPKPTCAPEVHALVEAKQKTYSKAIDLWSYGFMIAMAEGYRQGPNSFISPKRFQVLLTWVDGLADQEPLLKCLSQLLNNLLVWAATERWSAAQALSPPLFQGMLGLCRSTSGAREQGT